MTLKALAKASFDTIETTASVLFIVTAASIFAWLLTVSQAAQILSDAILGITQNKWVFLLLANLLILFVGCFIDTIAAITILVPILLPIVLKLGIDPIHRIDHHAQPHDRLRTLRSGWSCSCSHGWPSCRWSARRWPSCLGSCPAPGADRHHLHSRADALAWRTMGVAK